MPQAGIPEILIALENPLLRFVRLGDAATDLNHRDAITKGNERQIDRVQPQFRVHVGLHTGDEVHLFAIQFTSDRGLPDPWRLKTREYMTSSHYELHTQVP